MNHEDHANHRNRVFHSITPQAQRLYDYLLAHMERGITRIEADYVLRIAALPRRIADLKEVGVRIKSERKKDEAGRTYVRYWLNTEPVSTTLAVS